MNSSHIQNVLTGLFSNYEYRLMNSYIFGWESDFFAISKSGYSVEVEVKISKGDFKADYKKTHFSGKGKHHILTDKEHQNKPNKFYFACPEGLIKLDDIDDNYGLIHIHGNYSTTIRDAKFLHKGKILDNKHYLKKLLDKFYYRNIDLKRMMEIRDCDIKFGQQRLNLRNY